MVEVEYPTPERIIEYNYLALQFIKVKKADQPKVLSYSKISDVVLLKGLIQKHAFASGNRRTAFITTKEFVLNNHSKFGIKDDLSNARVMTGIRKDYYTDNKLKEWIKNGKIKEFKR